MGRIVGFTGTRHGMTNAQLQELWRRFVGVGVLHHGMCVGSDEESNDLARNNFGIWTVGHPPKNGKLRSLCFVDELREPKDYLDRDHDIVDESDELIATPSTFTEVWRSGTWATIRYAILEGKPVTIIYPDGKVEVK